MSTRRINVARERNEIGLTNFTHSLRSLFIQIQQINTREIESEYLETLRSHLEDAIGSLQLLVASIGQSQDQILDDFKIIITTVLRQSRIILEVIVTLERQQNSEDRAVSFVCPTTTGQGRGPGRPALVIQREQIEFLRELHFSWAKIAQILGISESTLRRKRDELQLSTDIEDNFSELSDNQLKEIATEIRRVTPNIGQRRLQGAFRARGFKVQRSRVRQCLRELDPLGTALRWNDTIYRRKYSVPAPNSLWHIDGNHKLIRVFPNMVFLQESGATMGLKTLMLQGTCWKCEDLIEGALSQVALYTTAGSKGLIKMFTPVCSVILPRFLTGWNLMAFWTY
ncbi:uncharacterized protein LOC114536687 isoform X2 [Dendronephthya gigantea]|uniref:uncharacterized protein LOC114536687 isoform X2 n=1 Tax=Dendronephthya gigantea TaxID=151771 RepID=UPI00106B453D|nr:uncharacterized protein LOC114536687 isoform X2 [Dendronephthya gigantea]